MGFVLGQHTNPFDVGVNAVGQGEIDNSEFTAERNRWFGSPIRQYTQPAAAATGQDDSDRAAGKAADETSCFTYHPGPAFMSVACC